MFLIAHRANNNHGISENSQNAVANCINTDYIDGVEIDVRITKDKELVLIHDPVIDFCSSGRGMVKYMTLGELKKYKYGKSSELLTTLKDVLEIFNNKLLLIELKEVGNDYINLVDKTISLINNYPNINIYICSFNFGLLTYLKSNYPSIKCGLIIGYGLNKLKRVNNFDFLVLSFSNLKLINKNKENFIFGFKDYEVDKIKEYYLITDKSYLICKNNNLMLE